MDVPDNNFGENKMLWIVERAGADLTRMNFPNNLGSSSIGSYFLQNNKWMSGRNFYKKLLITEGKHNWLNLLLKETSHLP